jgi:putative oxidoreductase
MCFKKCAGQYMAATQWIEKFMQPVVLLVIRFWLARIFWYSGLIKISSWQSTVFLFREEYRVPFFSPEMAAFFSTVFEIACPIMLIMGFMTRFATLPLLVMTAFIQYIYPDVMETAYWVLLFGVLFCFGPGKISLDEWLKKKFVK